MHLPESIIASTLGILYLKCLLNWGLKNDILLLKSLVIGEFLSLFGMTIINIVPNIDPLFFKGRFVQWGVYYHVAILGQCAAQGVTLYCEPLKVWPAWMLGGFWLSGDSKEPPLC